MSRAILTFTGKSVDVFDLNPFDVDLHDIAHALSLVARFGGHSLFHYSVAHHSLLVAQCVWEWTKNSATTRAALMHDAAEAYLGDMPSPIKHSGLSFTKDYKDLCRHVQGVIDNALELDVSRDAVATIKEADECLLYFEANALFTKPLNLDFIPRPARRRQMRDWAPIQRWDPSDCEKIFKSFWTSTFSANLQLSPA